MFTSNENRAYICVMEQSQSSFIDILFDKRFRILWHVLFWVTMYIDPIFSLFGLTPPLDSWYLVMLALLVDFFLVYLNLYVLIPKFLMKERVLTYFVLCVFSLSLILIYNHYSFDLNYDPEFDDVYRWSDKIADLIGNASMLAMAIAIKLFKQIYQKDKVLQQINEEKLKTELGFLKNQVNPHFLFNTMNSFYIQAKKKDGALPEAILSLSDLLRYQIYDTTKDYVPLENELNYIRNYLDLENNRRDNLDIQIKTEGNFANIKIAPLLLLPLVENAVKYSQKTDGTRAIINIKVEIEDEISFAISNTKGNVDKIKSPDSGIGLNNLKKRLELIYPNDYSFGFKDSPSIYTASLILGKR